MAAATEVVRATLNFAVDASDGGVFSNDEPEKSRQTLASFEIAIHNARELSPQASVWHEGFMLASHPISNPDFHSEQWLRDVYLPSCLELVKRISGARNGFVFDEARVRTAGPREGKTENAYTPAFFAHLDIPRPQCSDIAQMIGGAKGISFKRAAIFNVWKLISPPPHNLPLTVCDQRTISEKDHAIGKTLTKSGTAPYVSIVHSPEQKWFYYPNMNADESIVFIGENFDVNEPLGSAHTAFKHPAISSNAPPRSSIEVRIVAIFE